MIVLTLLWLYRVNFQSIMKFLKEKTFDTVVENNVY